MSDLMAGARDDVAFVRALVSDGGRVQSSVGAGLLAGGLCYGAQCVGHGLLALVPTGLPGWGLAEMIVAILPSLVFAALIVGVARQDRRLKAAGGIGVASRALGATFGSMGLSALATAMVFGYAAIREHSLTIWLFHPIMVCVAQGVGWYMAFMIRRRGWYAVVSAGWFASALALTTLLHALVAFVFVLGAALFALMALPGWALWRAGRDGYGRRGG
jgi:hypothetical protein